MSLDVKVNIPKNANTIIHILESNGHEAYVVGGCVRDFILGREPNDWDICTSATPAEMLEIFKDKQIIETGLQHGTVTVVIDGEPYEVTTYRIDGIYSDNRRPDSVAFTDSLAEDLKRRDFTINAMAYNNKTGLVDPYGGLKDLQHKYLRCVGSPKERFEEDALRILRAVRFAAQLGFRIDPDTENEAYIQRDRLNNISVERINSEFCKIINSNNFGMMLFLHVDLFSVFIPEIRHLKFSPYEGIEDLFALATYSILNCERYAYIEADMITKLAVMFCDIGKYKTYLCDSTGSCSEYSAEITDEVMRRLRFDNDTREKVIELVYHHSDTITDDKVCVKKWLNKIGEEQFRRMISLRMARMIDAEYLNPTSFELIDIGISKMFRVQELVNRVIENKECYSLKDLAVNGNDLIALGYYEPGKKLGKILNELLLLVIEGAKNDKDVLLDLAQRMYENRNVKYK